MRTQWWMVLNGIFAGILAGCGGDPPSDAGADTASDVAMGGDAGADVGAPNDIGNEVITAEDAGARDANSRDVTDAGGPAVPRVVHSFAPAMSEFPESVALHGGAAYVSLAFDGRVVRVTSDGTTTDFGRVPIPAPMSAFALGIATDASGNVYVALAKADPTGAAVPGVYRIPAAGGMGVLFASHPMMQVPNDLDFDTAGNAYITEAPTGTVFRAGTAGGTATIWRQDALLQPSATAMGPCGMRSSPFPIGVNGIAVEPTSVVVGNTERASVLRIAIAADGSAGLITTIASGCATLGGLDGLARDGTGWLATVQSNESLVRIAADGVVMQLHRGAPLTSPAAVDVGDFGGVRQAVIADSAFTDLFTGAMPRPNLAALAL